MPTYILTTRQVVYREYEVEADSEEKAREAWEDDPTSLVRNPGGDDADDVELLSVREE